MKTMHRTIGIAVVSFGLMLVTGCDTPSGAGIGALLGAGTGAVIAAATHQDVAKGALIGAAIGGVTGGIIGKINADQKAKLQQASPGTYEKIQRNDEIAKKQANASQTTTGQSPSQVTEAPAPLTVDEIKAMTTSGIKPDVVVSTIKESKSVYTQQDIDSLKQTNPNIDPTIIECMKNQASS
jgi:outer membrane lipoprotein SlyB